MILVSGSLAYDQIMDFAGVFSDHILPDKIHTLNVSFLVDKMRKTYGGTAGNIAYTLSLLGIKTGIIGCAGEDFDPYREFLEKYGVNTKYVKKINKFYTSTAIGITDKTNNHIWGFYMGADALSDQLSIGDVEEPIDYAVVSPNNPRTMMKFAEEYRRMKIPFLFDPGMQLRWLDGDQLKTAFAGASIIIGNDYEISVMERKTGIPDLHNFSEEKIIITTLGESGSRVTQYGQSVTVRSAAVSQVLDPAGAGDAYRAGFLAGFLRKFRLEVCAQMGSVAAAYTVEKPGTSTHYFTPDDFVMRYEVNYEDELEL